MEEPRADAVPGLERTTEVPVPPRARRRLRGPGAFRRIGHGVLKATDLALHPRTGWGRAWRGARRVLMGRPLATSEERQQRLSKTRGLAVMASDNLSSSAYATEEIMRILLLGGAAALALTMEVSLAVALVLVVVIASFMQVVRAYPGGGGSYAVAKANLGANAGLVAASALITDYILTVAVSVSAGVAALTSMVPSLYDDRVGIALGAIVLLTVGNLRGVQDTARLFALPPYLYVAGLAGLIGYGLWLWSAGALPEAPPTDEAAAETATAGFAFTALLLLRAFASGSVALTGVEAVSNGVPYFRPPEARNARAVLAILGLLFLGLFLGLGFLVERVGVVPLESERETVLSQFARALVGVGPYYVFLQIATAVLLFLAANTAYSGFPRLSAVLSADRYMPRTFAERGERLSFSSGILFLATVAALLVLLYDASVSALIPLYTVGVFVAFTLSQAGMVRHWLRTREPRWQASLVLNAFGAVATGVVALEVAVVKFTHGAWIVLGLMPLLVLFMRNVHRHFARVREELKLPDPHTAVPLSAKPHVVIVPVTRVDKSTVRALAYARSISEHVVAVHVAKQNGDADRLRTAWADWAGSTPLVVIESPYRKILAPLLAYIDELDHKDPGHPITVVVPSFVPNRPWHYFLHSQTAERLRVALRLRPNTVVTSVPYHLND